MGERKVGRIRVQTYYRVRRISDIREYMVEDNGRTEFAVTVSRVSLPPPLPPTLPPFPLFATSERCAENASPLVALCRLLSSSVVSRRLASPRVAATLHTSVHACIVHACMHIARVVAHAHSQSFHRWKGVFVRRSGENEISTRERKTGVTSTNKRESRSEKFRARIRRKKGHQEGQDFNGEFSNNKFRFFMASRRKK